MKERDPQSRLMRDLEKLISRKPSDKPVDWLEGYRAGQEAMREAATTAIQRMTVNLGTGEFSARNRAGMIICALPIKDAPDD